MRFSDKVFQVFRRDVLVYGAQIIAGAVIARALGPAAMGLWLVLLLIPTYAESIGRLNLDTAAVYLLGRGKHRVGEVAFVLVVTSFLTAALVAALFLWQEGWLFRSFLAKAAPVKAYAYFMLAFVPVRFLVLNYGHLLLSSEDVTGYNTLSVLANLVPSVLAAILIVSTGLGVFALVAALFAGGAAAVTYGAVRIHRREPIIAHRNLTLVRELFSFGARMYLVRIVDYLYLYISALLVVLHLSAEEVAFFRMAQDRALLISRLPGAVGTLLFPRVARLANRPEEARALAATSFRLTLIVLVGAAAIMAALATPGVLLLYGRAYAPMILPLVLFVPGVAGEASSGLLTNYFIGRGRLWLVLGTTGLVLLLQIAVLREGVSRWGVIGATVGAAGSYLGAMALRVAVFSRIERIGLAALLLPRRGDMRFLWEFMAKRSLPMLYRRVPAEVGGRADGAEGVGG